VFYVHQASVYEFVEAGTRVLQVSAIDAECPNSSCITYSLEPADNDNSAFVVDSQTGLLLIFISPSVDSTSHILLSTLDRIALTIHEQ